MIQVHRLEGFYWVARTGGYARAARAFPYPITQPAVHQQVKKLEGELGTTLFERVAKDRMRLTPAGRQLYEFAGPFFQGLPSVVRTLQASTYGGDLHIHADTQLLCDLLPPWVRRLQRKAPGVKVHLQEVASPDVEELLRGEADIIVSYLPQVPNSVATRRVGTLHGYVVVPRNHALAKRTRVSLKDLGDETFISYSPGLRAYDVQMRALQDHGVEPTRTISAGTQATILAFVEAGLGVTALATLDPAGPKGRGIKALQLAKPKFEIPVVAAWRRGAPSNPILEAALTTAPK